MDYKIRINLSLLNNAIETEVEIGDSMEKGIFIPYRYAPIYKKKKGVFLHLFAKERRANAFGQSHYLRPNCDKLKYEQIKLDTGMDAPFSILGNMTVQGENKYWRKTEKDIKKSIENILDND